MTNSLTSAIYSGQITHRRFAPKAHSFNYRLYMLALDVDEVEEQLTSVGLFGKAWFKPLRFVEKDYLRDEPNPLKQRIIEKVEQLGGGNNICRITMLVQVRCFGFYFSPANFYFCYDNKNQCQQMLVEVSNTPWNERHYYLVDLTQTVSHKKAFHVSPFMDLAMRYHWRVNAPNDNDNKLSIQIENRMEGEQSPKVFDATMRLERQAFTQKALTKVWLGLPVMTFKIVAGIYWQALKLFVKRIPIVGYQRVKEP